jgi:hypothetical protein
MEDSNLVTTSMNSKFDIMPLKALELAKKEDITWY